jgi:hypothetical protein
MRAWREAGKQACVRARTVLRPVQAPNNPLLRPRPSGLPSLPTVAGLDPLVGVHAGVELPRGDDDDAGRGEALGDLGERGLVDGKGRRGRSGRHGGGRRGEEHGERRGGEGQAGRHGWRAEGVGGRRGGGRVSGKAWWQMGEV